VQDCGDQRARAKVTLGLSCGSISSSSSFSSARSLGTGQVWPVSSDFITIIIYQYINCWISRIRQMAADAGERFGERGVPLATLFG